MADATDLRRRIKDLTSCPRFVDLAAASFAAGARAAVRSGRTGGVGLRRQGVGPLGRQAARDRVDASGQGALQRVRPCLHLRPERAPTGQPGAASRRHGPRRRRDPGDLRTDLPDLDRRSCPALRLLPRLQRLAARFLQGGAGSAHRPADAAGDARGRRRRAGTCHREGRRPPGQSDDRQRHPSSTTGWVVLGVSAMLYRARHLSWHITGRRNPGDRAVGKALLLREYQVLPRELLDPSHLFAWAFSTAPEAPSDGRGRTDAPALPEPTTALSALGADDLADKGGAALVTKPRELSSVRSTDVQYDHVAMASSPSSARDPPVGFVYPHPAASGPITRPIERQMHTCRRYARKRTATRRRAPSWSVTTSPRARLDARGVERLA